MWRHWRVELAGEQCHMCVCMYLLQQTIYSITCVYTCISNNHYNVSATITCTCINNNRISNNHIMYLQYIAACTCMYIASYVLSIPGCMESGLLCIAPKLPKCNSSPGFPPERGCVVNESQVMGTMLHWIGGKHCGITAVVVDTAFQQKQQQFDHRI